MLEAIFAGIKARNIEWNFSMNIYFWSTLRAKMGFHNQQRASTMIDSFCAAIFRLNWDQSKFLSGFTDELDKFWVQSDSFQFNKTKENRGGDKEDFIQNIALKHSRHMMWAGWISSENDFYNHMKT